MYHSKLCAFPADGVRHQWELTGRHGNYGSDSNKCKIYLRMGKDKSSILPQEWGQHDVCLDAASTFGPKLHRQVKMCILALVFLLFEYIIKIKQAHKPSSWHRYWKCSATTNRKLCQSRNPAGRFLFRMHTAEQVMGKGKRTYCHQLSHWKRIWTFRFARNLEYPMSHLMPCPENKVSGWLP